MIETDENIKTNENKISYDLLNSLPENVKLMIEEVQKKNEMNTREMFIKENHPNNIYQQKTDNRWVTRLYDERKEKLIKVCRKNKEDLYKFLEDHYKSAIENPTVGVLFYEYLNHDLTEKKITKGTYDRYEQDYNRFILGTKYDTKKTGQIDELYLEEMIISLIIKHKLTKKSYSGLRLIIRQMFFYAKKNNYTNLSISVFFGDLNLSKNMFEKKIIEESEQVFFEKEVPLIKKYLFDHPSMKNLALLLNFNTGVRVGELVALKFTDVDNEYLRIRRTERRYKNEDGKHVYQIKDFPKSECGVRDVVLTDEAKEALYKIREMNPDLEYMFVQNDKRIHAGNMNKELYKVCNALGIKRRSSRIIRRTFATTLVNAGVSSSIVTNQMGHADIKTTNQYYLKQNKYKNQIQSEVKNALQPTSKAKIIHFNVV